MWYMWLIIAGIFFIAEIFTAGFLIFWLGIAALITMCLSFFVQDIIVQSVIFVISSAILIPITKPFVNKFIHNGTTLKTNISSIIGKKGIVIEEINNSLGIGQIKVKGEVWSAQADNQSIIPKDTEVEILEVEGVKVIVKTISVASINV